MRHKLKWLTAVAAITLLSMTGLQLFWLQASYKEQQRIFLSDAEYTLFSALLKHELSFSTGKDTGTRQLLLTEPFPQLLSSIYSVVGKVATAGQHSRMSIHMTLPDSIMQLSPEIQKLAAAMEGDADTVRFSGQDTGILTPAQKLPVYKKIYEQGLAAKGYNVPFELGFTGRQGEIIAATCDTSRFKQLSVVITETSIDGKAMMSDSDYLLQIRFPSLWLALLQKMASILIISLLLIVICISSFTWLSYSFFKQKRLSDVRNDFMNNMTHELKTPISSVSVAIELMRDAGNSGRPEDMQDYLQIAQGELNRLTMLVEKVLKIAAFEKSNIDIRKEPFLAAAWLQQISNSFKPRFETGGVVYQSIVEPELLMMYGDKTHLTNVLQNLIDNSIKYNDKETPVINVNVYEHNSQLYITVKDNGKGIESAYHNKVFDKFFRVPAGDQHDVKGYGLGLSYVKEIVTLHNGVIKVESHINQGSMFTIILPKHDH